MSSTVGRLVVGIYTNKSGGAVAYGDVVYLDSANDASFTTGTTSAYIGMVGVCIELNGIANNASGRIQLEGDCAQVNLSGSTTRGHFIKTHTVAKQATDAGASRVTGAFGQLLTTGSTPRVWLFGLPDGSTGSAGSPATPGLTLSTTNSAGVAATLVATDATIAAFDSTVPVTQASGDSAATGSAGVAARRDHKHGMPAASSYPGAELDYVEYTSGNLTISATTEATATTIVTGNSVAYDGSTAVIIEFFNPEATTPGATGGFIRFCLYDGSSSIGYFGMVLTTLNTANGRTAVLLRRKITPSNASHTYSIRAYRDGGAGTAQVSGGTGGTATYLPSYIRITKA